MLRLGGLCEPLSTRTSAAQTTAGQTPGYPHGSAGSCAEPCDCGGVPCGEYLWDHRNASLRSYLVNEVVLGANGLGNKNVSGFYFDDGCVALRTQARTHTH